MRTQLNAVILAMIGDNCGPTEPTELYPGMMWGDTSANRLKRRTNANDAWVNIGPLDDFLGDLRTQIAAEAGKCVLKTGDTMTGALQLQDSTVMFKNGAQAWYGYVGPYGNAGQAGSGMGFVNAALNAWNFQVGDDGSAVLRNRLTISAGGLWSNARVTIANAAELCLSAPPNNWAMYMRYNSTGVAQMEWVNNGYNAVIATLDDGGTFRPGTQGCVLGVDGNLYMPWYGGWLSDMHNALINLANSKAPNGAQVQWNSGISELGSAMGGTPTVDASNPWVMEGVRITTSTDINRIYPRVVWLRNA
ncbi:hypothetical protein [Paraburkholderia sp. UCT70]|uniref:hypothetical protein n=1 Tax=Paraburkholderia sp. UCT70 TaxID=2991068 RepID=UPI003D22F6B4